MALRYLNRECLLIIPCYNEEQRLPVEAFLAFARKQQTIGLLFVNDGSRDETLALLRRMEEQEPGAICVLDLQPNGGKAEAVRAGMLAACNSPSALVTGFWDADLATPLSEAPRLLEILRVRPELAIVMGSRVQMLGRMIQRNRGRHYFGRIFATVSSITLGLPVYDTQCGAKLLRVSPTLVTVLAMPFLSRWVFDVEILARFKRLVPWDGTPDWPVYEEPLQSWRDVGGSKVRPIDSLKAFRDLLRIRRAQ